MATATRLAARTKSGTATELNPKSPQARTSRAQQTMPASKAKTHLLELLDTVNRDRSSITITKRGKPVATLTPISARTSNGIFGCMKGTGQITGDVVGPEPDVWNAMVD
jgi:prevent-host-death family protein